MAVFNGVFPIQAGKEADARAFAAETSGARRRDFEAHLTRVGITRETWSLQETPMGSLMVVWFEGDVDKNYGKRNLVTNRECVRPVTLYEQGTPHAAVSFDIVLEQA